MLLDDLWEVNEWLKDYGRGFENVMEHDLKWK